MKNKHRHTLTRRAVYILNRGFFLVISMLAVARLYIDRLIALEGGGEWARATLTPLAREMLGHTLLTLAIIVIAAIVIDIADKTE